MINSPLAAARKKPVAPPPPAPVVPGGSGAFRDRDGAQHEWRVNSSFTLLWDGTPYLPVGMTFTPRSFAAPDQAEAWAADKAKLDALKQAGITDLCVQPGRSAPEIPTPAWQRLIDALEADGFHYGLALPAPPREMAAGYYVHAGVFQLGPLTASGDYSRELPIPELANAAIQRVACAIIDQSGKWVRLDWAKLEPGPNGTRATLHVEVAPGQQYTVVMVPLLTNAAGLPDLWNGFGDARDSLLPLAKLKFGSGLRFLIHPFANAINLDGASGYVIPDSDTYHVEFEAFLTRKYRTVEAMRGRWVFRGELPKSMEVAARLVPMTMAIHQGRLVGYLLDEKEQHCYVIDPTESNFWYDHLYFREDSLRGYQNMMAQFVREQIADVPVVVQRAGDLRAYHINDRQVGGFTGVGIQANALRLLQSAGLAVAEARLAATRPWCLSLGLDGYGTKESLFGALDTLRQIGMKGWFVTPASEAVGELPAWLAAYRVQLASTANVADYLPQYVLYPHSIRETGGFGTQHPRFDMETRQLAPGSWWIPTMGGWESLDVGPDLRAYSFPRADGDEVYIWAPKGKQSIHLLPASFGTVEVRDITGKLLQQYKSGKRPLRLDLTEQPVILTGMAGYQAAPIEVAQSELAEFERLVKAVGITNGDVRDFQQILVLARNVDPGKHPKEVRDLIRLPLETLRRLVENQKEEAGSNPAPAGSKPEAAGSQQKTEGSKQ